MIIIVATLDKGVYRAIEHNRRIYSVDGIAPTITAGGGTHTPKILVVKDEVEERHT